MSDPQSDTLEQYQWTPQPQAGALTRSLLATFTAHNAFARELQTRLLDEAGVRLLDMVDYWTLPPEPPMAATLADAGFVAQPAGAAQTCFAHEHGLFPRIVIGADPVTRLFIGVESAADFAIAWNIDPESCIEGEVLSDLRRLRVNAEANTEVWAVERHGNRGFAPLATTPTRVQATLTHAEALRRRRRQFESPQAGFAHAARLIDAAVADLGADRACDLFFATEREYWQRRNRDGAAQKARQDHVGIGWANHDHHTYRSSRQYFAALVALLEKLGMVCRERFYAGGQAGWGAQILEQPQARIVVFADVDLSSDELRGDFAHAGLPGREELGTVGLWCALHGEAILEAGMHHLECQFDFDAMTHLVNREGRMMAPFTNFPFLQQAFTQGQTWPVAPDRIARLAKSGQITPAQAAQFAERGAIGSHLENLERNDGFKGFNQTGVSEIITRTDPRNQG